MDVAQSPNDALRDADRRISNARRISVPLTSHE